MPLKLTKRGSIWHVVGTIAGHRIRESTGLGDRRQAEAYRLRREAEASQRHALGRAATYTFAEAALTYLQSGGEGRFLGPILDHFGPRKRIIDVDNAAANECAATLYPDAAPATINRQVITPISAVVNAAVADELCPPRRFKRRKEPQGRLRWLTPEEADKLIAAADPRTRRLILFLLGTGCRPIEAFQLEAPDLHLATREAWIWRSKTEQPRMVEFPTRTRAAMIDAPEIGAVFLTPKGQPYKTGTGSGGQASEAFNQARDAAELGRDVTPYTLRHTWATWYHATTGDFGKLMDLGGWAKADTANRYRKIAPADLSDRLVKHGWDFGTKLTQGHIGQPQIVSKIRGKST